MNICHAFVCNMKCLAYVLISVCNLSWSHLIRGPYFPLTLLIFSWVQNLEFPNSLFQLVFGKFTQIIVDAKLTTVADFQRSSVTRPHSKYLPQKQMINQCFQNLLLANPFWLRIITTDPRILARVNVECRDDGHKKFKIYASKLILDSYEYIPVAQVTVHYMIRP